MGGGLRANAVTISLLGFECTLLEIKSKDMNEKDKYMSFSITNHIYAFSRPSWSIAHGYGVCTLTLLYLSARSACTHTVELPAADREGVEGCMYSNMIFSFPLSLSQQWIIPT